MHGLLGIGIAVVVLALLAISVISSVRGDRSGFERIARCSQGHLFTTTAVPGASFKAIRLGSRRFQPCPVGRHWTFVRFVDEGTLTAAELDQARSVHDARIP